MQELTSPDLSAEHNSSALGHDLKKYVEIDHERLSELGNKGVEESTWNQISYQTPTGSLTHAPS